MAKSTGGNSLASPAPSTSSVSSPCSSYASSISSGSTTSTATTGCKSSTRSTSDKSLNLKTKSSSIDRRKRLAANARERKRMHLLNKAYDQLRHRLVDAENKSKYDVLVQAKEYIQALATLCEKFDQQNPCPANQQLQQQQRIHHHRQVSPQPESAPQDVSAIDSHHYLDVVCKLENSPMDMSFTSPAEHPPYIVNGTLSQAT